MLASLLINAPDFRSEFCGFLAVTAGQPYETSSVTRYRIETEQSIEGKRDDLRIETFIENDGTEKALHLWTIEIKVGARIHESSAIFGREQADGDACLSVSQLRNYDHWLARQSAPHRAGFVLALDDLSSELPEGLKCTWECFTWTGVGLIVRKALNASDLVTEDRLLCKHVLGFILEHFWRAAQMPDVQLGFDDFALLRAFAEMRDAVHDKVASLVGIFEEMLGSAVFGAGKLRTQSDVFARKDGAYWGACVEKHLVVNDPVAPCLCAGIDGNIFGVWVWARPRHEMRSALQGVFEKLNARNKKWYCDESKEHPLCRDEPLTALLGEADQIGAVRRIVGEMLAELQAAGFTELVMTK